MFFNVVCISWKLGVGVLQFLNHHHCHSASPSLTKFHLKFQFLFDARFIFPTLSKDKRHKHTFKVASKPQHTLLV